MDTNDHRCEWISQGNELWVEDEPLARNVLVRWLNKCDDARIVETAAVSLVDRQGCARISLFEPALGGVPPAFVRVAPSEPAREDRRCLFVDI